MKLVSLYILIILFLPYVGRADDNRPLYVEITELQSNSYKVQWKAPPSVPIFNMPIINLPDNCDNTNYISKPGYLGIDTTERHLVYRCEVSLEGQTITIDYPAFKPTVVSLIKFKYVTGEQYTKLISPQETSLQIPVAETASQVMRDYTYLGMYHIWIGIDHLLFLLCLLLIADSFHRILITITGFTVAHSLTLILSVLDLVWVPTPPVETVIALSIVFLATEIVKGNRNSLTWRYPVFVSSSFGLLHGFGFAAALSEIGLPQTEIFSGLLFFNVGVEIGQILFALNVILMMHLIKYSITPQVNQYLKVYLRKAVGYGIGSIASFWVIERFVLFTPHIFSQI